jgi:hypothetical protein
MSVNPLETNNSAKSADFCSPMISIAWHPARETAGFVRQFLSLSPFLPVDGRSEAPGKKAFCDEAERSEKVAQRSS